jgi:hypothetical protein
MPLPGKGEGFIFLVASISLAAVALLVAALIIVMSERPPASDVRAPQQPAGRNADR